MKSTTVLADIFLLCVSAYCVHHVGGPWWAVGVLATALYLRKPAFLP
jgi:hypothetical protein